MIIPKHRHIIMSDHGPVQYVQRPTRSELYEDASRILDELLQKQYDPRTAGRRHPPHLRPTSRDTIVSGQVDNILARSSTLPSRLPEPSRDEPKYLEELTRKSDKRKASDASSADTEGDSACMSKNRQKKGLVRKVRDRLQHAFHRQDRKKSGSKQSHPEGPSEQESPNKAHRKSSKHAAVEVELEGGADLRESASLGSKNTNVSSQKDAGGSKWRDSRKTIFSSIRNSFRSNNKRNDGSGDKRSSSSTATSKSLNSSPEKDTLSTPVNDKANGPPSSLVAPPPPARRGSVISGHQNSSSPFPHSTSTESQYYDASRGNKSSSQYSFSSAHVKNSLDDPDDDIPFIDCVEDRVQAFAYDMNKSKSGTVLNGHSHRPNVPVLKRDISLCIDGDTDVPDGKASSKLSGNNPDKELLYEKVAQKIASIGDNYAAESGLSDAEGNPLRPAPSTAAQSDTSDLEREILNCLRLYGDRLSVKLDGVAETVMMEAKAHTYEQFKETIQHSMGNEISWNQVAILFYTTKGVMSAFGKGSKMANQAKEMTLQYFSDQFAGWIMDKGGFNSAMSDSDSELD